MAEAGEAKPTTLGHYELGEKLGEGGMGVVYRAVDTKLRREVALKLLPPELAADPERRSRLLREARAAAAVTHKSIATIYDVGESGDRVFIAMELVVGQSLRQRIASARLPLGEALRIVAAIASGLAKAHDKGIIHRDLKPDNVMVTPDGDVKILDFGLAKVTDPEAKGVDAKALESAETQSQVTEKGMLLGTPHYMSPEQAAGKQLDHRTDIFSLGIMLYELATGQRPFRADSTMELLIQIARDEPTPPSEIARDVPPALERIIARCLAKAPAERYGSARELSRELEALSPIVTPASANLPISTSEGPSRSSAAVVGDVGASSHRHRSPRVAKIAAAALLAGASIYAGAKLVHTPSAPGGATSATIAPSASASAAPRGVAVTDRPRPKSKSPAALAIFVEAMEAAREGGAVKPLLKKAIQVDPDLAAAHVELAAYSALGQVEEARPSYDRAVALSAELDDRDRGILDALEPVFHRSTSDFAEATKRWRELVSRFPNDAELEFLWCATGSLEEGLERLDRAIALDPGYARAFATRAQYLDYLGQPERAYESVESCLRVSKRGASCLTERERIDEERGECARMESDARMLETLPSQGSMPHRLLARALVAQGKPSAAARASLEHAWKVDADEGPNVNAECDALREQAALATLSGDFTEAAKLLDEASRRIASDLHEEAHSKDLRARLPLLIEMGATSALVAAADGYVMQHDAWAPETRSDDWALGRDPAAIAFSALIRSGKMPKPEGEKMLADRLAWWRAHFKLGPGFIWTHFHAPAVETAEEARAALAVQSDYVPLPPATPEVASEAEVGKVYFLAGRIDDALPHLERAAKSCFHLKHPIATVRAHAFLGMAKDTKGDKDGACRAFAFVREHWGHAKPKSTTFDLVAPRMRALGCP